MICAWDKLLRILPTWMREDVNGLGKQKLLELRLRLDKPPQLKLPDQTVCMEGKMKPEDFSFIVNSASNYSPWAAATISQGYITAEGGHRIGLCGEAVVKNGIMTGIRRVTSVNIRVARDIPGLSAKLGNVEESLLLIGPPGSGKTTLLRDLIRRVSRQGSVCVVDERGELFPDNCFSVGAGIDVLYGCSKSKGIELLLRTMGPDWIAVDEITAAEDCEALLQAGWCGVRLVATAHALDLQDLRTRPVYRPLWESGFFRNACILSKNRTYRMERIY